MGREVEGELRVVARRMSFSVRARSRAALRRSLSDCSEWVLDSRAESFVSSSLTWRSLRSRKARWLERHEHGGAGWGTGAGHVRCPVLCLAPALRRRQAVLLLAAAARLLWLAVVEVRAEPRVYAADGHGRIHSVVCRAKVRVGHGCSMLLRAASAKYCLDAPTGQPPAISHTQPLGTVSTSLRRSPQHPSSSTPSPPTAARTPAFTRRDWAPPRLSELPGGHAKPARICI